jgi:hypothetical protein
MVGLHRPIASFIRLHLGLRLATACWGDADARSETDGASSPIEPRLELICEPTAAPADSKTTTSTHDDESELKPSGPAQENDGPILLPPPAAINVNEPEKIATTTTTLEKPTATPPCPLEPTPAPADSETTTSTHNDEFEPKASSPAQDNNRPILLPPPAATNVNDSEKIATTTTTLKKPAQDNDGPILLPPPPATSVNESKKIETTTKTFEKPTATTACPLEPTPAPADSKTTTSAHEDEFEPKALGTTQEKGAPVLLPAPPITNVNESEKTATTTTTLGEPPATSLSTPCPLPCNVSETTSNKGTGVHPPTTGVGRESASIEVGGWKKCVSKAQARKSRGRRR